MPELYWFAVKRGISAKDALQIGLVGLIFILVVFVIANVLGFATSRGQLPANTYLGDVNVSGLSAEQASTTRCPSKARLRSSALSDASHGCRSSSVSGMPARIFSTLRAG